MLIKENMVMTLKNPESKNTPDFIVHLPTHPVRSIFLTTSIAIFQLMRYYYQNPGKAQFGTELTNGLRVAGTAEESKPANGCSVIVNKLAGKIAIIHRGGCMFIEKVRTECGAPVLVLLGASILCGTVSEWARGYAINLLGD